MSAVEWLVTLMIVFQVYTLLESAIDPDAVKVRVNNWVAGSIRIAFTVAILIALVAAAIQIW